jgi:hypothetical protein
VLNKSDRTTPLVACQGLLSRDSRVGVSSALASYGVYYAP